MIPNIGPMELIIVAIIALVVLGPKRLPDAGRSLGRGMREFKSAISGSDKPDELDEPVDLAVPTNDVTVLADGVTVPANNGARPLTPAA